ncbi:uncharacterized protein [Littorina saxatilis]|uniref:Small vasohibin-binding protein n=1 Tax=Littorina saxatilis TaxID=31220 RepID=A0AAN9AVP2_9CAEN
MLTTGLQLSGTQINYLAALTAPGNIRSATMPRSATQGPVAVNLLTANCKVMQLHQKPLEVRSKLVVNTTVSVLSVYAPRPTPMTRASTNTFNSNKNKKRSSSTYPKPLLQKRTNSSPTRNLEASHVVRKSLPSNSSPLVNSMERRVTKVYLSQKQSAPVKDCGVLVPGAPPATPTPDHLKQYEYVPSLTDIKSQRHMRHRLERINKADAEQADKRRGEQAKQEQLTYKEKVIEQKKRQRQEIYALNKVMTDLEYINFEELVKTKGLNE